MSISGLVQNWWVMILRGLCGLGLGWVILTGPNLTVTALGFFFSVYLLTDGLLAVSASLTHQTGAPFRWLLILEGLFDLGVGALTLLISGLAVITLYLLAAWTFLTGMVEVVAALRLLTLLTSSLAVITLYLLATWAFLTGMVEVVALRLRSDTESEVLLAVSGILSIALGIVFVFAPAATTLSWWMGSYALASGLMLVGFGLRLRNWQWSTRRRPLPLAPVEARPGFYPLRKKASGPK